MAASHPTTRGRRASPPSSPPERHGLGRRAALLATAGALVTTIPGAGAPSPGDAALLQVAAEARAALARHGAAAEHMLDTEETSQHAPAVAEELSAWAAVDSALRRLAALPAAGLEGLAAKVQLWMADAEVGQTPAGVALGRSLAEDLARLAPAATAAAGAASPVIPFAPAVPDAGVLAAVAELRAAEDAFDAALVPARGATDAERSSACCRRFAAIEALAQQQPRSLGGLRAKALQTVAILEEDMTCEDEPDFEAVEPQVWLAYRLALDVAALTVDAA